MGRHVYESRILRDGYTIDDVVEQITSDGRFRGGAKSPKMT
jgi:hypothetical protein